MKDSTVKADVETDPEAHYVLLSTCAYTVYDDARTVIHGRLVPVDSAGGVPSFISCSMPLFSGTVKRLKSLKR